MGWHPYDLDHLAQEIVLKARKKDPDSLNQAYKMRATCAYGLERFWGNICVSKPKTLPKLSLLPMSGLASLASWPKPM